MYHPLRTIPLKFTITLAFFLKRPRLIKKKILFHRAHLRSVDNPNYGIKIRIITASTGFGPQWLFLFPNLKKWLGGQRFTSNEEVIAQTDAYFEDLPKSYFLDGLKKLEKRLEKYIELKDFVKKKIT